jgi:SAM-dependent methyltransferase
VRTRFEGWPDEDVARSLERLERWRDRVLDGAALQAGERVADVGAGTGLLTLGAVDRVGPDGDVIALDISVDALEELRGQTRAPNISYLVGQADVLPLRDESVDALVTRSVLIYVDDKAEAAREFARVLRSGGRVSLFEPINSRNLKLAEAVDFGTLGELGERVRVWNERSYATSDDPMLNFDETDLERHFRDAGLDVRLELGATDEEIEGAQYLTQVGAPGRPAILARWRDEFTPEEVDVLVAFMEQRTIPSRVQHAFLTARKP